MAWTSVGFDGTITEIQWAGLSSLLGNGYVAAGNGDCKVTAVGGARSVSVAAGSLYGDGVQSTNSGAETVALTTPVNGQWYLIVLRRTWASNTAALVAVAGATTSTTIPSSAPSTYPTINSNVGVLTDQPIAWAWCNSATTDVVVSDLRQFPVRTQESLGNTVLNGDFSVNQRNFSSTTSSTFGFDRWNYITDGISGTATHSSQTFTPGFAPVVGYEAKNYARIVTTGQTSADTLTILRQKIEDVRTLAGKTATVSFWAKAASGTPKIALVLKQTFGGGGSPSSDVDTVAGQVTISTVWTRYSITVAVPSISGKTLGTDNASALIPTLFVSAGSTYNSATVSMGIQSNTFDIWGVQVEAGSTATPFKTATGTKQGELAACQRYYFKLNAEDNYTMFGWGVSFSSTNASAYIYPKVPLRTRPGSIEWSGTGSNYGGTGGSITNLAVGAAETSTQMISLTVTGTGFSTGFYRFQANNNTSAYLGFSAEL